MEYGIACVCGRIVAVSPGMAGSHTLCSCGRTVYVPPPGESPGPTIPEAAAAVVPNLELPDDPLLRPGVPIADDPPPLPNLSLADDPLSKPKTVDEIIAPTLVSLKSKREGLSSRRAPVMVLLTTDALWIQDTWELRHLPLHALGSIEARRNGKELVLACGSEPSSERLMLTFESASEGERWYKELQEQQQISADALPDDGHVPAGISLLRSAPDTPYEALGRIECSDRTPWAADRGLQLRAALAGADAVIEVDRRKVPDPDNRVHHVVGRAIRVEDAADRQKLRLRWYAEEVRGLVKGMLVLLTIEIALLFVVGVFCAGISQFHPATGETPSQALASTGMGLGVVFAWPVIMIVVLAVLHWPQLLRTTGLALLAATTGRGLMLCFAQLVAFNNTGAALSGSLFCTFFDPVDWAFILFGIVLCRRAWRLANDAPKILPQDVQSVSPARKVWGRSLFGVTGVYALALFGFVAYSGYERSAHVLQPGADPKREQEALLAFNEALAHSDKEDLDAARRSWERSLRVWEELTTNRKAPSVYRVNLARTLHGLGWVHHKQGRLQEAEKYYSRCVALADELGDDPQADNEFKQSLAGAREFLDDMRRNKHSKALDEKDESAARKYEEAQIKASKGDVAAEGLYRESIAAWEEILPQATNEEYRKHAVSRLAAVYVQLGKLQQQLGKRDAAETSLRKGIDFGEKAVALNPDRPLARHNLDVARQNLVSLQEQAMQEQIDKLCDAKRYDEVVKTSLQGIEELEKQVRSGKDRDTAVLRLASRRDRFAWFIAHCPDKGIRNTRAAIEHARRATELRPDVGNYWFTLGMVQYRNGDWRDSLTSLDKVKAREGDFEALGWFLIAMNRHQLKQKDAARSALGKAVEWIEETQRKAEDNALLRIQFEMMRPSIEALRREAEQLIEGKNPGNRRDV
jgi:tetratricopeptide (TPR) repeat protein